MGNLFKRGKKNNALEKDMTTIKEEKTTNSAQVPLSDNQTAGKAVRFLPTVQKKTSIPKIENIIASTRRLKDFYLLNEKLGEGSYGKVRMARSKLDQSRCAVKSILKKKVRRPETLVREIGIMKEMSHPNIVRLLDVFEDSTHLHIVMELCLGGELFDYITSKKSFSENEAALLMRQILGAVAYLHEKGIAHRDLKPENFLFKDKDDPSVLKIIDFGLSRFYKVDRNMKTRVGTPYYIAPEVLAKNYGPSCDVWSVGVIMYILLCGYPPFWGDSEKEIFARVRHGKFDFPEEEWDSISSGAKDLINRMLTLDVQKRITAKEALQHPWFAGTAEIRKLHPEMVSRLTHFSKQNKVKRAALAIIARWLDEKEIKNLKQQFQAIDADGNGTISVSELSEAMKKVGLQPSNQEVTKLLNAMDADGNGKLDYIEFIAATMEEHLYLKDEILHKVFEHFDKDHTGRITAEALADTIGASDAFFFKKLLKALSPSCDGSLAFEDFKKLMADTPIESNIAEDGHTAVSKS